MLKKILFGFIVTYIVTAAVPAFATDFRTSDLEGDWIGYNISVMPAIPAVLWLRGAATMDAAGNLTAATYTLPDGTTIRAKRTQPGSVLAAMTVWTSATSLRPAAHSQPAILRAPGMAIK